MKTLSSWNSLVQGVTTSLRRAGALALALGAGISVLAQPANDNFANATGIGGQAQTMLADNFDATSEPGEPGHGLPLNPGGASVWFAWTAPADMVISFDTEWSDFDTLLSVYVGTNLSSLTLVAGNDDILAPGDTASRVSFYATSNQVYYIAVDGKNTGGGAAQGNITLTWNRGGNLAAGAFSFATDWQQPDTGLPMYVFSENESLGPIDSSVGASIPARFTITRPQGANGRVQLDYTITNTLYTNYFVTNYHVNITLATNVTATATYWTNIYVTNTEAYIAWQDYNGLIPPPFGPWHWYTDYLAFSNIVSVSSETAGNWRFLTNVVPPGIPPMSDCNPGAGWTGTVVTDTNSGATTITSNLITCFGTNVTVTVDTASLLVDYLPDYFPNDFGTLEFDDYEMTKSVTVTLMPGDGPHAALGGPPANRLLVLQMLNPRLDPMESADEVAPPTIITDNAGNPIDMALMNVMDMDISFLNLRPSNAVVNMELSTFRMGEAGGDGIVYVTRSGTNTAAVDIHFRMSYVLAGWPDCYSRHTYPCQAGSDYATPPGRPAPNTSPDYAIYTDCWPADVVKLHWDQDDFNPKGFIVRVLNDTITEFNEDIHLQVAKSQGNTTPVVVGNVGSANFTVLFDPADPPAGAVDINWNTEGSPSSVPPNLTYPGANRQVRSLAVQKTPFYDGYTIIGGDFTSFDATARNYLARLLPNGYLDTTFMAPPNSGPNSFVAAIAAHTDDKIIIGGDFTSFNGVSRYHVARLNANGSLDTSFNPGLGANGVVWAVAPQWNGQVVIAGEFTSVGGQPRTNIARLNADGTLDATFNQVMGANGPVYTLAIATNGAVILGGDFTTVAGQPRNRIARLSGVDGSLDTSFSPGSGADGVVYGVALQPDGKVVLVGSFTQLGLQDRSRVGRLNWDGSLDTTFQPGSGADDTVYTVALQPDGGILLGGVFQSINESRRICVARLLPNGPVDTSFMDTAYNQFAGLVNHYHSGDAYNDALYPPANQHNFVRTIGVETVGGVLIGGEFLRVGGGSTRDDIHNRSYVARLVGGATPGPGNLELLYDTYSADENGGTTSVTLTRVNGVLGPVQVTFTPSARPPGPGNATLDDYTFPADMAGPTRVWDTLWPLAAQMKSDASDGPSYVPIIINDNKAVDGNRAFDVGLSAPYGTDLLYLGGEDIPLWPALGRRTSPLGIIDDDYRAGVLGFSVAAFSVSENGTNAIISVTRTNGSTGSVAVQYSTANGTAVAGTDYTTTSGTLSFSSGQTNRTFSIPIADNSQIQADRTVNLRLRSPSGGASLGLSNAVLTIVDNDFLAGHVSLGASTYATNESAGAAIITVNRAGGAQGYLTVQAITIPGSAVPGVNYIATTNTLVWNNGESDPRTFLVPLLADGVVGPNRTVQIRLTNPSIDGALGTQTNATLTIQNDEYYGNFSFSATNYNAKENGGYATLTVLRTGGGSGTVTVGFATSNLTAVAGLDYDSTNGVLTFAPNEIARSFRVGLVNGTNTDPLRAFTVWLGSPTPTNANGPRILTTNTLVTLVDDESFNEPAGSVDTAFVPSSLNAPVRALAVQADKRILVGGEFTGLGEQNRNYLARINPDASLDNTFLLSGTGPNDRVHTLAVQSDRRILVGGRFTQVNGVARGYFTRLNYDGSLDTSFDTGQGSDNPVWAVQETFPTPTVRRILVAGEFTTFNSVPAGRVARLNDDGTVDLTFQSGLGANNRIYALAVYPTNTPNGGKILIGGDFTTYNGVARPGLARLNPNGTLDSTFAPADAPGASLRAIALQLDGRIVIGGVFTNYGGAVRTNLAGLLPNGALDPAFDAAAGANGAVLALTLQPDLRILAAGDFTRANGVTRNRITRLLPDGTVDPGINFGTGANGLIHALALQTDDKILIGGGFTQFDGVGRDRFARLYGGSLTGSGAFEFTAPWFGVIEGHGPATLHLRRRGGTHGTATVDLRATDGTAIAGVHYQFPGTNTVSFPPGETFRDLALAIADDSALNDDRTATLVLDNPAPAGAAAIGLQPIATLIITNDDSTLQFSAATYARAENAVDGRATITTTRAGSTLFEVSALLTTWGGTATPRVDYTPVTNRVVLAPGITAANTFIPLVNDGVIEGDETVGLTLSDPAGIGASLGSPATAMLTIVDDFRLPPPTNNHFAHSRPIAGNFGTTLVDTTGASAELGEPAHAGQPATNSVWFSWTAPYDGPVTFDTFGSDFDTVLAAYTGDNVARLSAVAANDYIEPKAGYWNPSKIQFNAVAGQTYHLAIDAFGGGVGQAQLAWAYHSAGVFRFSADAYVCSETDYVTTGLPSTSRSVRGVRVTVTRMTGANGRATVDLSTTPGTALADIDYLNTSMRLVFDDWEMSKSVIIPIGYDGGFPAANRQFTVNLSTPLLDPLESSDILPPRLDPDHSSASVTIFDWNTPVPPNPPGYGMVNFERSSYRTTEGVTTVQIRVYRQYGVAGARIAWAVDSTSGPLPTNYRDVAFDLAAGSDYATPDPSSSQPPTVDPWDFRPVYNHDDGVGWGELTWGGGDNSPKTISITINSDAVPEFNEDFIVRLYPVPGASDSAEIGQVGETTVTILHDDLPSGAVDPSFNIDNTLTSQPPRNTKPGANGTVYAMVLQPGDEKAIIGGNFTTYNDAERAHIARINYDGTADTSFDPQAGIAYSIDQRLATVTSLALDASGRIVLGGLMTTYNGVERNGVARANANGSLDTSFNPGLGTLSTVWAVAVQNDGKVLVAGDFTTFNSQPRKHIVRLNENGSVDTTFDPGPDGPNNSIYTMALDPSGGILIGGAFTEVGGQPRVCVARLRADGKLDTSFAPLLGADDVVYSLAVQPDGKVLLGGAFTRYDNFKLSRLARVNSNGRVDSTFEPGFGADDTVFHVALMPNGYIHIGGLFRSFNGTHRQGFARLQPNGQVETTFLDTAYNHYAGLPRAYFNQDVNPKPFVLTSVVQSDGRVMIAGDFDWVGGGSIAVDAYGRAAVQTNLTEPETLTRAAMRSRANVARLMATPTLGPGNIGLAQSAYTVDENGRYTFINIERQGGTLGRFGVNFTLPERAVGYGKGQAGIDFSYADAGPLYETTHGNTRCYSDAIWGTNHISNTVFHNPPGTVSYITSAADDILVTIIDNSIKQENRVTPLQVDTPTQMDAVWLGGENIPVGGALGRPSAQLTIRDDEKEPGTLGFAVSEYFVNENGGSAVVTVTRTNGSDGVVSIQYATTNAALPTATALLGTDFTFRSGTLTFLDGQTVTNFTIPIINDSVVEPEESINLRLFNPGGGAAVGVSDAVCWILDDDFAPGRVNFTQGRYATNEDAGWALLTVTRTGGNVGAVSVQVATADGTNAVAGRDYVGFTNTLVWNDGDTSARTVAVRLLGNALVEPDKLISLRLFNASTNGLLGTIHSNAVVAVANDDFYGVVEFASALFSVKENGGRALVTVSRHGGSAETITVNYETYGGAALPGVDYTNAAGVLTFGPGEVSKTFAVGIVDNALADGNRWVGLTLANATPVGTLGAVAGAWLWIMDDESYNEPAGSVDTAFDTTAGADGDVFALAVQSDNRIVVGGDFSMFANVAQGRIARLKPFDGSLDHDFLGVVDGPVRALLSQSDDRVVVGGSFATVNGVTRNRIARLSYDGSLDTSFLPGSGCDAPVYALAETFVNGPRKLIVGGAFTVVNSVARNGVARLNDDGSVDTSFGAGGAGGGGVAGTVFALAVYPTNTVHAGKIVVGGSFTAVGGVARKNIARLNVDGSLDTGFDPGSGASDIVRALAVQPDGRVLLGGGFTNVAGAARSRVARLNVDGSLDTSFAPGVGANDSVYALALQEDGRILVGGEFTRCSGVTRGRLTRLLPSGAVDPQINFGLGADNFVAAVAVQHEAFPDGSGASREKILIGGGFTSFDGVARQRVARIYGGSLTGMGRLEFTSGNYSIPESATNATILVRRKGGTAGPSPDGNVTVRFATADGSARSGVNYYGSTNTLTFPQGETLVTVAVPIIDDLEINADRTVNLSLTNVQPVVAGGPALGGQPFATLTIVNDESGISFASPSFTRAENAVDGVAAITLSRTGYRGGPSTVEFATTTNGTAVAGVDYVPVTNQVTFLAGDATATVLVPLVNNTIVQGDRTVTMELREPTGGLLLEPSAALLTIVEDDTAPGRVALSASSYTVNEGDTNAVITLIRTNGWTGIISVSYTTVPGTAVPNADYAPIAGNVVFGDGVTNKQILVPLMQDLVADGDRTFSLSLTNVTGGASLAQPSTASVLIRDDDVAVAFDSPVYVISEGGGSVTMTVRRPNGTNGVTTVWYATTNVTATSGADYRGVTNKLVFNPGETVKSLSVSVLEDNIVDGEETFMVRLFSPSNTPPLNVQLATPSAATVFILDNDTGFLMTNTVISVMENITNAIVTILRTNANTGTASVSYATSDLTALSGGDYMPAAGTLTFLDGEAVKTIAIPILDDKIPEGDETFVLSLFNPSPGAQLLTPSEQTITIRDNDSGLRFSSTDYTALESGVNATITVLRDNYLSNTVSVQYITQDGTANAGVDYTSTTGTLVFTNGETSKTFSVTILDDTLIEGDQTVLLSLFGPNGDAAVVTPGAATLTIMDDDGSSIQPAGAAILSESLLPKNNSIDPNETVEVWFALRNAAGQATANLTATLKATNGVSNPTSTNNNYGVLVPGGNSKSRLFRFTANTTNGAPLAAAFQLRDGTNDLGEVAFNFVVGTATATFSNTAPITIRDGTTASPYPSTIDVSGVGGAVTRATVTISNLTHGFSGDLDMLLAAPSGSNVLFFSDVGSVSLKDVSLTFDDAATGQVPATGAITNGTYKPTNVGPDTFPTPAPREPWGATMADLNGGNPNGLWSLFIMDDSGGDSGMVNSGWRLQLTVGNPVLAAADLSVAVALPASQMVPVVVQSNITYLVTVTNHGPGSATGVAVTNWLPAGAVFVSATGLSAGSWATNGNGQVVWTVGSLTKDASASMSIIARLTQVGVATNSLAVSSSTSDLNSPNNTRSLTTAVVAAEADLSIAIVGPATSVPVGSTNVTYQITVYNTNGAYRSTASSVMVTNRLPSQLAYVGLLDQSGQAALVTNAAGTVSVSLGDVGSGKSATFSIVARALSAGTVTNGANVVSVVTDPRKANNATSVKTVIDTVSLAIGRSGNNLQLSWPADVDLKLQFSATLNPTAWQTVSVTPQIINGRKVVSLPIGTGMGYYRLTNTGP